MCAVVVHCTRQLQSRLPLFQTTRKMVQCRTAKMMQISQDLEITPDPLGSPTFIPATLTPARATMGPPVKEATVVAGPVLQHSGSMVTFAAFDYLRILWVFINKIAVFMYSRRFFNIVVSLATKSCGFDHRSLYFNFPYFS